MIRRERREGGLRARVHAIVISPLRQSIVALLALLAVACTSSRDPSRASNTPDLALPGPTTPLSYCTVGTCCDTRDCPAHTCCREDHQCHSCCTTSAECTAGQCCDPSGQC